MYPKIKKVKSKTSINDVTNNIKDIIFDCVNILRSGEYFILFIRKCFHF